MTPLTEEVTAATATAEAGKETERAEFQIDSDGAAEWLLRKLANLEAEKARISTQAAKMLAEIEGDAQRLKHLYEGELLDYCRRKMAQNGNRRRSVTFFQGTVSFRTVAPSMKVADPAAALAYAQAAALSVVKTVVTLDAAAYRAEAEAHLQTTGELLPGLETTPEHESYRITFGGRE